MGQLNPTHHCLWLSARAVELLHFYFSNFHVPAGIFTHGLKMVVHTRRGASGHNLSITPNQECWFSAIRERWREESLFFWYESLDFRLVDILLSLWNRPLKHLNHGFVLESLDYTIISFHVYTHSNCSVEDTWICSFWFHIHLFSFL